VAPGARFTVLCGHCSPDAYLSRSGLISPIIVLSVAIRLTNLSSVYTGQQSLLFKIWQFQA